MLFRLGLVAFEALFILSLGGCKLSQDNTYKEHFRLIVTQDGRTFRLDTQTGDVVLVTDKGLSKLSFSEIPKLQIGHIYALENGDLVKYQGNQKFDSKIPSPPPGFEVVK